MRRLVIVDPEKQDRIAVYNLDVKYWNDYYNEVTRTRKKSPVNATGFVSDDGRIFVEFSDD